MTAARVYTATARDFGSFRVRRGTESAAPDGGRPTSASGRIAGSSVSVAGNRRPIPRTGRRRLSRRAKVNRCALLRQVPLPPSPPSPREKGTAEGGEWERVGNLGGRHRHQVALVMAASGVSHLPQITRAIKRLETTLSRRFPFPRARLVPAADRVFFPCFNLSSTQTTGLLTLPAARLVSSRPRTRLLPTQAPFGSRRNLQGGPRFDRRERGRKHERHEEEPKLKKTPSLASAFR